MEILDGNLVRDMTDDEIATNALIKKDADDIIKADTKLDLARLAARESALAKLADLGLTAEEIGAL